MLKMIITEAVVSKGYDGAPGIRFFDSEGAVLYLDEIEYASSGTGQKNGQSCCSC